MSAFVRGVCAWCSTDMSRRVGCVDVPMSQADACVCAVRSKLHVFLKIEKTFTGWQHHAWGGVRCCGAAQGR
jgi:hypothetical protein